jgi:hypothetical protein
MTAGFGQSSNVLSEDMAERADMKDSKREDEEVHVDEGGRTDNTGEKSAGTSLSWADIP